MLIFIRNITIHFVYILLFSGFIGVISKLFGIFSMYHLISTVLVFLFILGIDLLIQYVYTKTGHSKNRLSFNDIIPNQRFNIQVSNFNIDLIEIIKLKLKASSVDYIIKKDGKKVFTFRINRRKPQSIVKITIEHTDLDKYCIKVTSNPSFLFSIIDFGRNYNNICVIKKCFGFVN